MVKKLCFFTGGRGSVVGSRDDLGNLRGSGVGGRESWVVSRGLGVVSRGLGVGGKGGQMKIMQMSFMIIAVFFFFILVGLFFLGIAFKDIRSGAEQLQREQAISSLEVIAGMNELAYYSGESMSVDEDKLRIMSGSLSVDYGEFWPIASLEFHKVYPAFDEVVKCPAVGCNYYEIFDSGQRDVEKFSSYVSICKRVREFDSVYNRCEIGKIVVGMRILE
ncbi:hypothetical protein KAT36_01685 [Candidatus Pacearchaeota archaeon]|nr:hypothetical protein [Candidatus Pacearchaeota archaeon]